MTSPEKTSFWGSLSRAQITAWSLCGVLVLGTGLGGAYVALRVASARAAAPVQAAAPAAKPPAPPVEPPAKTAAAEPPPAPVPAPVAAPPAAPPPAPPRVEAPPSPPAQGIQPGRYLQVGAIDRPAVRAYMDKLAARGFKAFEAEGPNANTVRILMGPLAPEEIDALKAKVEAAGFPCFARRY